MSRVIRKVNNEKNVLVAYQIQSSVEWSTISKLIQNPGKIQNKKQTCQAIQAIGRSSEYLKSEKSEIPLQNVLELLIGFSNSAFIGHDTVLITACVKSLLAINPQQGFTLFFSHRTKFLSLLNVFSISDATMLLQSLSQASTSLHRTSNNVNWQFSLEERDFLSLFVEHLMSSLLHYLSFASPTNVAAIVRAIDNLSSKIDGFQYDLNPILSYASKNYDWKDFSHQELLSLLHAIVRQERYDPETIHQILITLENKLESSTLPLSVKNLVLLSILLSQCTRFFLSVSSVSEETRTFAIQDTANFLQNVIKNYFIQQKVVNTLSLLEVGELSTIVPSVYETCFYIKLSNKSTWLDWLPRLLVIEEFQKALISRVSVLLKETEESLKEGRSREETLPWQSLHSACRVLTKYNFDALREKETIKSLAPVSTLADTLQWEMNDGCVFDDFFSDCRNGSHQHLMEILPTLSSRYYEKEASLEIGNLKQISGLLRNIDVIQFTRNNASIKPEQKEGEPRSLFETNDLSLIWKPPGWKVHSGKNESGNYTPALSTWYYGKDNKALLPFQHGFLHRIDSNVIGALILCKNSAIWHSLRINFDVQIAVRDYLAIVTPETSLGEELFRSICGNIRESALRAEETNKGGNAWKEVEKEIRKEAAFVHCGEEGEVLIMENLRTIQEVSNGSATASSYSTTHATSMGKSSWTHVRFLRKSSGGDCAIARIRIYTGRSHQIRAHLKSIGLRLLCENKYLAHQQFQHQNTPNGLFLERMAVVDLRTNKIHLSQLEYAQESRES